MRQKNLIFPILFLLFSSFVIAQSGCFLYPESTQYCIDIDQIEAEGVCLENPDCNLKKHFSINACNTNAECTKILCKSTCTYEYPNLCHSGAVPKGEEQQWCSYGCCRFASSGENSCQYTKNKGLCEIDARNKDVDLFHFDSDLTKKECDQSCADVVSFQSLTLEPVSEEIKIESEIVIEEQIITSEENDVEKDGDGSSLIIIVALLAGIAGFLYYFFFSKKEQVDPDIPIITQDPYGSLIGSIFRKTKESAKVKKLKEKHKHKVKETKRERTFSQFSNEEPIKIAHEFYKLKRLVKHHQLKKKPNKIALNNQKEEKKKSLEKLRDMTKKK